MERPKSNNNRAPSAKKTGTTGTTPAPKLTAKGKLEQKKRLAAQQERKRQEEQEQKRRQIEQAQNQELRKKRKQEADRLDSEMPQFFQKCKRFQSAVMVALSKQQKQNQWQRYIEDSEMIDINEQKQLSKIIYGMKQIGISWNSTKFQRWIVYIFKVISELRNNLNQSIAIGNKQKSSYYSSNLQSIYSAINYKLEEYVKFVIDGIEHLLQIKNKELVDKGLMPLTLENQKLSDFNRKEDRYKYQIYESLIDSQPFKYGLWINLIKAGFRAKPVAFGNVGFEIQVPRQFLQSTVIISCLRSKFNQFSDDQSEIRCIGDVIELNIYQMVSLPRVTQKFTLKNITDLDSSGNSLLKKHKYQAKEGETLLGRITLPPVFYVGETNNIIMANYTAEGGWVPSKNPVQIDSKNQKSVKFQTNTFSVFSLALPKTIDYPYRGFFLRCIDSQQALLDLQTKRLNLQFSIGRSSIKLLSKNKKIPELTGLYDQEMISAELLSQLQKIGIIINPSSRDAQQIPNHKSSEAQDKVIKDIGFGVNSFAYKQSPMNSQAPSHQIVIQSKIHLDFEERDIPDDEYPWEPYLFQANKCGILNSKLKAFKQQFSAGTTTHISMQKALRQKPGNGLQVFEDRFSWPQFYPQFVITLKSFLKQLKLFSLTI